jgi:hypothetical protein
MRRTRWIRIRGVRIRSRALLLLVIRVVGILRMRLSGIVSRTGVVVAGYDWLRIGIGVVWWWRILSRGDGAVVVVVL